MEFELPPLPFEAAALEPHISARTVDIHYNKHHNGYLRKLDAALENDARREMSLEDLVRSAEGHVFNCAAQVWNHTFYWNSLSPTAIAQPNAGPLLRQIEQDFGSVADLRQELRSVAAGEFGSGWGWLVFDSAQSSLQVISTTDAENPLPDGRTPLLTLDVWEHAYYLDYQNERGKYLEAVTQNLLNWQFAESNFAAISN